MDRFPDYALYTLFPFVSVYRCGECNVDVNIDWSTVEVEVPRHFQLFCNDQCRDSWEVRHTLKRLDLR